MCPKKVSGPDPGAWALFKTREIEASSSHDPVTGVLTNGKGGQRGAQGQDGAHSRRSRRSWGTGQGQPRPLGLRGNHRELGLVAADLEVIGVCGLTALLVVIHRAAPGHGHRHAPIFRMRSLRLSLLGDTAGNWQAWVSSPPAPGLHQQAPWTLPPSPCALSWPDSEEGGRLPRAPHLLPPQVRPQEILGPRPGLRQGTAQPLHQAPLRGTKPGVKKQRASAELRQSPPIPGSPQKPPRGRRWPVATFTVSLFGESVALTGG